MKKILSLALCLLVTMSVFAGCKDNKTPTSSLTDSQIASSESDNVLNASQADESFALTSEDAMSGNDNSTQSASAQKDNNTVSSKTQGNNTSSTQTLTNNWSGKTVELINDADFSDGFSTSALINTDGYDGKIQFFTTGTPQWKLAQWYSTESIKNAKPVKSNNKISYSNQYKTVSLTKNSNNSTTLTLVCDGRAEYGGEAPTSDFYGWVHLGTEQYIRESPMLADLSSLRLKMNTKMDYIEQKSDADKNKYTTQYNVCMIIKNTNEKSKDYNKYIWVQVGLYDTRYDYPPEYCGVDVGVAESSGEFIYTMDSKNILKEPFANGNNVSIDYDWLPIFKKALNTVQAKGGMPNTKWEDMELLTFSFGYEVFRGEKYSVSTSDLSLKATYKNDSTSPVLGTSYTKGFSNPSDWVRAYGDWKISNGTISITESNLWTNRISLNRQFYKGNYDIEYEMSLDERYSSKDCWAGISFAKQYMQDDHGESGILITTTPKGSGYIGNFITGKNSGGEISGFELKKNVKYKVEVRANNATLYANGKKVCSFTDDAIKEGGYISLVSGKARVTYQNFKVTVK